MMAVDTAGKNRLLRDKIRTSDLVHTMAAHSPLSARLAEEAGFDAIWASGFELSALYGLPDVSLISMTQHLDMVRAMSGAMALPIVADIDTGFGNAVNVVHAIREYERAGASAVVIEDKTFPKVTSLVDGGRQELLRVAEFQGKIAAACATRESSDFLVIARCEALIAGLGEAEALARSRAYANAGADMILIHSKQKTPDEVESFIRAWDGPVPVVIVPTAYPEMNAQRIKALGKIKMVIYGNHAIRASVTAMQTVFARIRADGGIESVDKSIVLVDEIFRLQRMDQIKATEDRFLR
jgi:phosphoenolpyruvate phosphomutase